MSRILRRVAIAASIAIAAVFLWFRRVDQPSASSRIRTVPIVVAGKDIPAGVIVDRIALVIAQWPAGTLPAGAYANVDSVLGRVTRVPVYKGEAMVPGRLAPKGTGAGTLAMITPGKRAFGIRVNDVASLAGMIQPNSRVDIMVVVNDTAASKGVANLVMSNMRVLAIGRSPGSAQDGRPVNSAVATIEVTPDEAERLAIAASQASLQLMLRGYGDPDSSSTSPRSRMPNAVGPRTPLGSMPVYVPPGMRPDTTGLSVRRAPSFQRDSARVRP